MERIAAMNPEGLPIILTGDFNVKPEDPVLGGLNAKMLDARKTALKTDSRATFNICTPVRNRTATFRTGI